jgi:hypothetical protein
MSSNLQYIAMSIGQPVYANGLTIKEYEVYTVLNGGTGILVGSMQTLSQSLNNIGTQVVVNTSYILNVNDQINEYNFTWTSSNNINKDLVTYLSCPANLSTTDEPSVLGYSYSVTVANVFDNLFILITSMM